MTYFLMTKVLQRWGHVWETIVKFKPSNFKEDTDIYIGINL